ncbi:MAG: hypothetical protein AAB425_00490 [Bdellovibrionota bacterium]
MGRGDSIFREYFPRFYRNADVEFHQGTRLSLEEYFDCLGAIASSFLDRTPDKVRSDGSQCGLFNSRTFAQRFPKIEDNALRYIELESQTPEQLRNALWGNATPNSEVDAGPFDYKPLRSHPILRVSGDRAIVMDPVFLSERILVGPLFHLLGGNSDAGRQNELFGAFGKAFEAYSCDLLRAMFPSSDNSLSDRLACNVKGRNEKGEEIEIADAWVEYPEQICIFEMKAAWVPERTILTDNSGDYLDILRVKYGARRVADGERPKGVAQLARNLRNLASKVWKASGVAIQPNQCVLPILLVHDELLDAPVHGAFLANEFHDCLKPDVVLPTGAMKCGSIVIKPLIIMTIEDQENLSTSIEHFSLADLLRDYSDTHKDRMVSLHNFICSSKRYQLRHSRQVAAKALEVLNRVQERFV